MVKRPKAPAAVVKHTIEDQSHPPPLQLRHQRIKGLITAK
jgi:hypothetical protein